MRTAREKRAVMEFGDAAARLIGLETLRDPASESPLFMAAVEVVRVINEEEREPPCATLRDGTKLGCVLSFGRLRSMAASRRARWVAEVRHV